MLRTGSGYICVAQHQRQENLWEIHWSLSVSWPDLIHFSHSSLDHTQLLWLLPWRDQCGCLCVWERKKRDVDNLYTENQSRQRPSASFSFSFQSVHWTLENYTGHTVSTPEICWLYFFKWKMTLRLVCGLPFSFCLGILVMGEIKGLKLICQGSQSASHSQQS